MISEVLAGWAHTISNRAQSDPFLTIRPSSKDRWDLVLTEAPSNPRRWNAVNVICDLVAEMAWERLRSDPSLLCLHAGAVAFADRLVIFPNTRRAGKSTLTAALAQLGHPVFTDDFLPVRIDAQSQTYAGVANGVAPRIRLPLPDGFSDAFQAWVQQDQGPNNKQYKYLTGANIAPGDDMMALGAMVILDRQDDPVAPALTPIPRADALSSLITQNFARTQLSSAILRSLDALTRDLPVFRLTYSSAEQAAKFLSTHPALQTLPICKSGALLPDIAPAPLNKLHDPKPHFEASQHYIQAEGLTETLVDQDHFLADRNGLSIYRLNAGSVAIWNVMAEPTNLDELIEIVSAAFEDVAADQIASDSASLMRNLVEAGLLVPARADMAAQ